MNEERLLSRFWFGALEFLLKISVIKFLKKIIEWKPQVLDCFSIKTWNTSINYLALLYLNLQYF